MEPFERDKHMRDFLSESYVAMVDEQGAKIAGAFGIHGVTGRNIGADHIKLLVGRGFPLHRHPSDHVLYVIDGRGTLEIAGEIFEMAQGMCFYIPSGLAHAMSASSTSPLDVLAVGLPHIRLDDPRRMESVK